jgi:hypothetical protein
MQVDFPEQLSSGNGEAVLAREVHKIALDRSEPAG